jgi:UDP-N-acetylmuramate dehydrogenase
MPSSVIDRIRSVVSGDILESEPLSGYTTYRVGGEAEYFVPAADSIEAEKIYVEALMGGMPVTILGWGSNVIAPDGGIEGIVLKTSSESARVEFPGGGRVIVDAGVSLLDLARLAAGKGLKGLEPIAGIPGTLGGAIIMNAGTDDGDTGAVVSRVTVVTPDGARRDFTREEAAFGYRSSVFQGAGWLVLEAELVMDPGDPEKLTAEILRIQEERKAKFPLDDPNAGSVFKRPPGDYAGRLIEEAGCKGLRRGGAIVSPRHANFIINTGEATAADILGLADDLRRRVHEFSGIWLEMEQIPLPEGGSILPPQDRSST